MSSHKIDIIIPCFNYADFLDECLSLIAAQTRKDFQVLIMDNASEDETPQVAQRWMERDERIRYHRNETNLGAVGNMKRGYEMTTADYVVILPADDVWKPTFLERTCDALDSHPECSYAYTGWHAGDRALDDPNAPMFFCPHREGGVVDEMHLLTIQNYIPLSFGVFRRAACDKVGGAYPLFLPMLGDLYLWMRLSATGRGFYVNKNLGRLRFHGGNESHVLSASGRMAFDYIHLLDLIFESELWPLSIRLLARARQMQLMTGMRLADAALGFCSPYTPSFIYKYVEQARDEFLTIAADAIESWDRRAPALVDTLTDAKMLQDQVGRPLSLAAQVRAQRFAGSPGEWAATGATGRTLPLFARPRPYYIVADDFNGTTSGTRVMHHLCHALNLMGAEAYLLTGRTSPRLRTPLLNAAVEQSHQEAGLDPIIVYPESTPGNPLSAGTVVRYLYRTRPAYTEPSERTFAADPSLLDGADAEQRVLNVPIINRDKFCPKPVQGKRWLAYAAGYPDAHRHFSALLEDCTVIDDIYPATQQALIELFQGADRLYCFGESAIAVEASLCGCPVIYVPTPQGKSYPSPSFADSPDAFATTDTEEALASVRANLPAFAAHHAEFEAAFVTQLEEFVQDTQNLPTLTRPADIYEEHPESILAKWVTMRVSQPAIDFRRYHYWRNNRAMQEVDGQLMAERMVREWPSRPRFHLLVEVTPGEENLLADSLDALDVQLYPEWRLTIVSPMEPPDDAFDGTGKIRWITENDPIGRRNALTRHALDQDTDWCALIQPGVRLEPFALQVLGDYLWIHPEWKFIYSDEDLCDAGGTLSDPRFKPDLNLDLLRSIDYLGGFCPVSVEALRQAGGLGKHAHAETYDIALRVLDGFGATAIGHIPEVLYHSPACTLRDLPVEAERQIVSEHLARLKVDAIVQDGHGCATRRVIYRHADRPKVSIVVLSRDKAEFLGPCLDSLFARTSYPSLELIVLDAANSEPDARALLDHLQSESNDSVRVVPCVYDAGVAAQYNLAAAVATGEYLLFLDDDTVILQDDWLDRLMATAQRPEVGMVGPRYATPGHDKIHDTGAVLGFRGVAGTPYPHVLTPDAPGYLGFKTLDQNVSALSPACFLVRASLFHQLGGFNSQEFSHEYAVLELCLRISASHHWIVWTPYVTLARYGSSSRTAQPTALNDRYRLASTAEREGELLLSKWLPTLASDPFYNRNLSLSEAYQPEHRATINWDRNFHERKRLIGFPVPGGSGEYRVIAPFRAINRAGLAQTCIVQSEAKHVRVMSLLEIARAEPDVIVVHQAVEPTQISALESYKKYCPNIRRVTGLDDLISLLPPKHPSYRKRAVDIRPRLRASLNLCDRVIVSTEPLAELCRPLIDEVILMPNCLEWDIWGDIQATYEPGKKPRVGWIGAQQHYGDLEHIFEVVRTLSDEVDWVFMGMCPDPIRKYVKEYHPWTSGFAAYSSKMASLNLDLAIAPLDVNPFNEAKSNLRLLEYGVMRWPVVCTDIYPYQDAPVTRVQNTPQAWLSAIREKLSDRVAARQEGERLREWVAQNFVLENRAAEWLAAYTGN